MAENPVVRRRSSLYPAGVHRDEGNDGACYLQHRVPLQQPLEFSIFRQIEPHPCRQHALRRSSHSPWQTRITPVDTWGNVNVPKIGLYEKAAEPDAEGWYNTIQDDSNMAAYTAFVGIPIDITDDINNHEL